MSRFHALSGLTAGIIDRILQRGIGAGFVASTAMGLLAMVASATYQGRGFYTPVYHVAFIIDPNTMPKSLERAAAGERFFFSHEAFLFGLATHIVVAGIVGALFALVAIVLQWHGTRALRGGVVYGLAVMAFMSLVVLPSAASISGAGEPISRMGGEIGWPTFIVLHALFGLILGGWLYIRPNDLDG